MAAGLSRKQRNSRVYNALKHLQYKLALVGVPSVYRRFQLCAETTGLTHNGGFNVSYNWSNASNGECFGMQIITIRNLEGGAEYYGWQQPNGDTKAGVTRIVELFSRLAPEARPTIKY